MVRLGQKELIAVMTTGERIKQARLAAHLTQKELAEKVGLKFSAIHKYETGMVVNLKRETIAALAVALNVKPSWLMCMDDELSLPRNVMSMPSTYKVPRLGRIACGDPILAEENIEDYDNVPSYIKCDFTLICRGDSMINARIFDGDIVCIKADAEVNSGDIAAVLVDDDTATLKRVRLFDDHIILEPENPTYKPKVFWNEDMNRVRIIGKATHFISTVK